MDNEKNHITMLRYLMSTHGWNQAQAAEEIGCSQHSISRYLSEKRKMGNAIKKMIERLYQDVK